MGKEKKEIGMEKLIELLNEREKTVNGVQYPGWCKEHLEYQCHGPRVINKRFGFIKWLVENDKINKRKIDTRLVRYVENHYDEDGYWVESSYEDYSYTDTLLMLLAIQNEPIEFLISTLK